MRYLLTAAALAATTLAAAPASAAVILSTGFEDVSVASGSYSLVSSAGGWTAGVGQIEVQNNAAGAPHGGTNLVELDSTANSSMFYTLGSGTYTISYWYSARPGVGAGSNGIDLSIGGTTLDSVALAGGNTTNWLLRSLTFTTTGGNLTFAATGTSDSYGGYLDDITISTAAVPEPATWAMMILGFGLVGAGMRRRRPVTAALAA